MSFERSTGKHLGQIVLKKDGAILTSSGDLQNDERTAAALHKLVSTASKGEFGVGIEKISVNYLDHCYVVSSAANKIHIVKKTTVDSLG